MKSKLMTFYTLNMFLVFSVCGSLLHIKEKTVFVFCILHLRLSDIGD